MQRACQVEILHDLRESATFPVEPVRTISESIAGSFAFSGTAAVVEAPAVEHLSHPEVRQGR
jgi:hypothetical protein